MFSARLDIGDLIVLFIFLSPVIKAIFDRKNKSGAARKQHRPQPRPTQRPAERPAERPTPAQRSGRPMTWEDLLEGRGSVEPAEAAPAPRTRAATIELEDELHEHRGPMVPDELLAPVAVEDEFERHGGDFGNVLAKDVHMGDEQHLTDLGTQLSPTGPAATTSTRRSAARTGPRGGWRAAFVHAEILAGPVALRDARNAAPFGPLSGA
ncbi:MAG: hypothetical protein GY711_35485 [bacterium]|nr:hypothetical protein [bacterium]